MKTTPFEMVLIIRGRMMYKCECCHAIFTEPRIVCFRQNLDGENGIETVYEEDCPWCGSEWFTEADDEE